MHTHTLGWTSNDGCNVFALGWLDTAVEPPVVPPEFTPEPVYPPGTSRQGALIRRRIQEEDEMLMLVIRAFLAMKDRE